MNEMGCRLRKLRNEKNLSITSVAEQVGLSIPTISGIEVDDNYNPTLSTLKKLSEFYGVTIGFIIGEDETKIRKLLDEISQLSAAVRYWSDHRMIEDDTGPSVSWLDPADHNG